MVRKVPMNRIFSIFVIFIVAACSTGKEVTQKTASEKERSEPIIVYTDEELAEAKSLYIRGMTAFEMQDYNDALDLLTMAYIKTPNHAGINYALADAYMYVGDFVNAAYYAKHAVDIDSENVWYQLKLAEIYIRAGESTQAVNILEKSIKQFPNSMEVKYLLAGTYAEQGKFLKSNEIYDEIMRITGEDPQIYFQKYRNFTRMNDDSAAAGELERILKIDPDNTAILQTLSTYFMETDQFERAISMFEEALERNPLQTDVKINLADVYIRLDDWENAGSLLLDVFDDPDVSVDGKLELVQFVMSRYVRDQGNETLKEITSEAVYRFSSDYPDDVNAQAMAADFFLLIDDEERAIEKLEETLRLMPYNDQAWRQLFQMYFMQSMYDEIIAKSDEIEEYVPDDVFIRFFIGNAFSITGDHLTAIEWLKLASEAPARSNFKSIVFGSLADTYQSTDNWDKAQEAYNESLQLDPDNATALNNYAYYLSVRNERLEEAYEMSKRSLEFEPENSSFLDTLGWIYYKKGDYENARKYIEASIENGGTSATILEHMGDVYDKLGYSEKAANYWNQALEADPERDYLRERLELN